MTAWSAGRDHATIGELMARWLEGDLDHRPGYFGSEVDPETVPLVPTLARLNRAGFVTQVSQPGIPEDDQGTKQRAWVGGFCDDRMHDRLTAAIWPTDLVMLDWGKNDEWSTLRIPVTFDVGEPFTWVGTAPEWEGELRRGWGDLISETGIRALLSGWDVTVFDPVWGRDDLLWSTLLSTIEVKT